MPQPTGQGDFPQVPGNTNGIMPPSTWDSKDPNPGSWFDQVKAEPSAAMLLPPTAPVGPSTSDSSPSATNDARISLQI